MSIQVYEGDGVNRSIGALLGFKVYYPELAPRGLWLRSVFTSGLEYCSLERAAKLFTSPEMAHQSAVLYNHQKFIIKEVFVR